MLSLTSSFPQGGQKAICCLLLSLRPPALTQPVWAAEATRGCCEERNARRGREAATLPAFLLLTPTVCCLQTEEQQPESAVRSKVWGAKCHGWYCRFLHRLWQHSGGWQLSLLQASKAYSVDSSSRESETTKSARKIWLTSGADYKLIQNKFLRGILNIES